VRCSLEDVPSLKRSLACPDRRLILRLVFDRVYMRPEAHGSRHVLEHLRLPRVVRLIVREDFQAVRVAGRGEKLLCLRNVVLVILRVRSEVFAAWIEMPRRYRT